MAHVLLQQTSGSKTVIASHMHLENAAAREGVGLGFKAMIASHAREGLGFKAMIAPANAPGICRCEGGLRV